MTWTCLRAEIAREFAPDNAWEAQAEAARQAKRARDAAYYAHVRKPPRAARARARVAAKQQAAREVAARRARRKAATAWLRERRLAGRSRPLCDCKSCVRARARKARGLRAERA